MSACRQPQPSKKHVCEIINLINEDIKKLKHFYQLNLRGQKILVNRHHVDHTASVGLLTVMLYALASLITWVAHLLVAQNAWSVQIALKTKHV